MNIFFSYKPISDGWMSKEEKTYLIQEEQSFNIFLIIMGCVIILIAFLLFIFIKSQKPTIPEDLDDDEFKLLTD